MLLKYLYLFTIISMVLSYKHSPPSRSAPRKTRPSIPSRHSRPYLDLCELLDYLKPSIKQHTTTKPTTTTRPTTTTEPADTAILPPVVAEEAGDEFPWLAEILAYLKYHGVQDGIVVNMTGALISPSWVLSCAHVLLTKGTNPTWLDILFNEGGFSGSHEWIVNPGFDEDDPDLKHDIALIKLVEPMDFDEHVKPIKLPRAGIPKNGRSAVFAYNYRYLISSARYCDENVNNVYYLCTDSFPLDCEIEGQPLVVYTHEPVLVGIATDVCENKFTRVSPYLGWIFYETAGIVYDRTKWRKLNSKEHTIKLKI